MVRFIITFAIHYVGLLQLKSYLLKYHQRISLTLDSTWLERSVTRLDNLEKFLATNFPAKLAKKFIIFGFFE